ncbi:MAG TPA: ABC transporter permease [Vicinamibacterales bacterium]|nr:ABC transporter permease [Vicinamibacterales bacterium]
MVWQDLRFGVRTLLRNRGVTAIAVLCLAIGIGLNASMFSVVDGILIQPLPFPEPDQLVQVYGTNQRSGVRFGGISWLELRDWRERDTAFAAMGGLSTRSLTVGDPGSDPQRYLGGAIGHEVFPMIGAEPQLGRLFTAEDDRPGAPAVAILSDTVWRNRYQADLRVIGRTIQINAKQHTVIGVMPPNFKFPFRTELWVPLAEYANMTDRNERQLDVFARLKPDVSLTRAQEESAAVAAGLAAEYPDSNEGWGVYVEPFIKEYVPDDIRLIVLSMMGAVTLVLLIACFNVANLMLARASTRVREISIRTALGAGRLRIVRQLMTESLLMAIASVPIGIAIAKAWMILMDRSMPPDDLPYTIHWSLDTRALLYTVGVAIVAGIVFGLAPALHASKPDLQRALKEGGRGTAGGGRGWMRSALVVAEVALSLVLLVGASLFVRSFLNLQYASGGFDTAPLMTMRMYLPDEQYPDADAKTRRVEDVLRRIQEIPGVVTAFASNMIPLGGGGSVERIVIDGRTTPRGEEPSVNFTGVTPELRATLGLTLLRGRDFTRTEGMSRTPVAIVNQAMAQKFWPAGDAIGRRFRPRDGEPPEWFTIVGVMPDFRQDDLDTTQPVEPTAFVPYPYGAYPSTGLTIRVDGDPAQIAAPARAQIRASDPSLAVYEVSTMEELRRSGFWQYGLFGWMFGAWGGIALLLAAVGVYGVLSYSVSQRTQEIGVRVALGADRRNVLSLVVSQGLKLAGLGVLLGAAGAFLITPIVKSVLYNVSPSDPVSFIVVSVFLSLIAFIASYVPARRATAVDPLTALRSE